jgi:hypothetical protein
LLDGSDEFSSRRESKGQGCPHRRDDLSPGASGPDSDDENG